MLSAVLNVPWYNARQLCLDWSVLRIFWERNSLLIFSMCLLTFIYIVSWSSPSDNVFLNLNNFPGIIAFFVKLCIKRNTYTETEIKLSTTLDHSLPHSFRSLDARSWRQIYIGQQKSTHFFSKMSWLLWQFPLRLLVFSVIRKLSNLNTTVQTT